LTDFTVQQAGSEALFRLAKNRWEIENQGFNDGKNRYGMAHIAHHEANSLWVHWLLILLAMTIERLYRLRYLHRGNHSPMTAIELLRRQRLSLAPPYQDSSQNPGRSDRPPLPPMPRRRHGPRSRRHGLPGAKFAAFSLREDSSIVDFTSSPFQTRCTRSLGLLNPSVFRNGWPRLQRLDEAAAGPV
jgi:hypothetical protein